MFRNDANNEVNAAPALDPGRAPRDKHSCVSPPRHLSRDADETTRAALVDHAWRQPRQADAPAVQVPRNQVVIKARTIGAATVPP
jgi:phytoene dehydrogenase-like protein